MIKKWGKVVGWMQKRGDGCKVGWNGVYNGDMEQGGGM